MTKPSILLVPDVMAWILGRWANEIASRHHGRYDFTILPSTQIRQNVSSFKTALQYVDAVHCLSPWDFRFIAGIANKAKTAKFLINSIHHISNPEQVADCGKADRVMTVCRKYTDELIDLGVSSQKIVMIPNGVDGEFFVPMDRSQCRKAFNISGKTFVIGFCGKYSSNSNERKGIATLIDSLKRLCRVSNKRICLLLSGPGWLQVVKQLNETVPEIKVVYSPYIDAAKMAEFYNAMDIYLITSNAEGGPAPLLEAMSCGIPIVTTQVGIVPEIVRDRVNGFLIPQGDPEKTAQTISLAMENEALLATVSKNGRTAVLNSYTWSKSLSNIDNLYAEIPASAPLNRVQKIFLKLLSRKLIRADLRKWRLSLRREVSPQSSV